MRAGASTFHIDMPRKRRKPMRRPEQELQISLVSAPRYLLTPKTAMFHVPNGGFRSAAEAGIFHAMGVVAGVPDLVFVHDGRAFGLELKAEDGRLTEAQRNAHVRLRDAGMRIETVRGFDEALERLREFGIPLRDGKRAGGPRIGGRP